MENVKTVKARALVFLLLYLALPAIAQDIHVKKDESKNRYLDLKSEAAQAPLAPSVHYGLKLDGKYLNGTHHFVAGKSVPGAQIRELNFAEYCVIEPRSKTEFPGKELVALRFYTSEKIEKVRLGEVGNDRTMTVFTATLLSLSRRPIARITCRTNGDTPISQAKISEILGENLFWEAQSPPLYFNEALADSAKLGVGQSDSLGSALENYLKQTNRIPPKEISAVLSETGIVGVRTLANWLDVPTFRQRELATAVLSVPNETLNPITRAFLTDRLKHVTSPEESKRISRILTALGGAHDPVRDNNYDFDLTEATRKRLSALTGQPIELPAADFGDDLKTIEDAARHLKTIAEKHLQLTPAKTPRGILTAIDHAIFTKKLSDEKTNIGERFTNYANKLIAAREAERIDLAMKDGRGLLINFPTWKVKPNELGKTLDKLETYYSVLSKTPLSGISDPEERLHRLGILLQEDGHALPDNFAPRSRSEKIHTIMRGLAHLDLRKNGEDFIEHIGKIAALYTPQKGLLNDIHDLTATVQIRKKVDITPEKVGLLGQVEAIEKSLVTTDKYEPSKEPGLRARVAHIQKFLSRDAGPIVEETPAQSSLSQVERFQKRALNDHHFAEKERWREEQTKAREMLLRYPWSKSEEHLRSIVDSMESYYASLTGHTLLYSPDPEERLERLAVLLRRMGQTMPPNLSSLPTEQKLAAVVKGLARADRKTDTANFDFWLKEELDAQRPFPDQQVLFPQKYEKSGRHIGMLDKLDFLRPLVEERTKTKIEKSTGVLESIRNLEAAIQWQDASFTPSDQGIVQRIPAIVEYLRPDLLRIAERRRETPAFNMGRLEAELDEIARPPQRVAPPVEE